MGCSQSIASRCGNRRQEEESPPNFASIPVTVQPTLPEDTSVRHTVPPLETESSVIYQPPTEDSARVEESNEIPRWMRYLTVNISPYDYKTSDIPKLLGKGGNKKKETEGGDEAQKPVEYVQKIPSLAEAERFAKELENPPPLEHLRPVFPKKKVEEPLSSGKVEITVKNGAKQ